MLRRNRTPRPRLTSAELATSWQVLSLLLEYPTGDLLDRRTVIRAAVAPQPAPVRGPGRRVLTGLESAPG